MMQSRAVIGEPAMARLLSVNVGLPRDVAWQGRTVHTGIWKARSQARAGCAGSTSMATARAIRPAMAANIVPYSSIRTIPIDTGRSISVDRTSFTANSARTLRSRASPTPSVCIGDRYRIGSALFEVTQPRVTCYRLGIRMDEPDMAALLVRHGRPGFYFRVIEEGDVEAGDEIMQVAARARAHERVRDQCAALHAAASARTP